MICVIDCGTLWIKEIKHNLIRLGYKFKVIKIDKIKDVKFDSFSGIIITGAPTLLTKVDQKKFLKPFNFIKTVQVPILGICLGHQVIGLFHGSKIRAGKFIDRNEKIEIVEEDELFKEIKNFSLFRESHCEYISLPDDFLLLAKSESCDNEAMKHKNKIIYGIQFHPEKSGDNGEKIMKNFLKMCK